MTTGTAHEQVTTSSTRPWGRWEIWGGADGYQVKRLVVLPGRRLSLQRHAHRAEHWVVVSGTATCTVGRAVRTVHAGGHLHVTRGEVHRLANDQTHPLVVIEVQLGDYLGEDDIERLHDDHGRA